MKLKYWQKNGPSLLDYRLRKIYGLDESSDWNEFRKMLVDYLGGIFEVDTLVKSRMSQPFTVDCGGYDFDFNVEIGHTRGPMTKSDNQFRVVVINVNIVDNGTVDLIFNERPTTEWISEIINDDEIGYEIEQEIKDLVFDRILNDLEGRFLLQPTINKIKFIPR